MLSFSIVSRLVIDTNTVQIREGTSRGLPLTHEFIRGEVWPGVLKENRLIGFLQWVVLYIPMTKVMGYFSNTSFLLLPLFYPSVFDKSKPPTPKAGKWRIPDFQVIVYSIP